MRREIRSYVLRQGRVTPAQERAYADLFPRFGIAYASTPLDPVALFGRRAPLTLEIGSGMGETTAAIAGANPQNDYIAVEVHLPGVGALLKRIEAAGITNLRVIRHDAVEVLTNMISDASLAAIHLYFPDPWPKKRHHKRRILQPAFAALAARKLSPDGVFHAATDWVEYAEHMQAVLSAEPLLVVAEPSAPRPVTKFERRGLNLGHEVRDLLFRRR